MASENNKMITLTDALPHLKGMEDHGSYMMAECPCCHKDRHLYIAKNDKDSLIVRCVKCGVTTRQVVKALRDLGVVGTGDSYSNGKESATYIYTDKEGNPLFYKERYYEKGKKSFRYYTLNENGKQIFGRPQGSDLLYNKAGLELAPSDQTLYIVEGEKDVDTLTDLGLLATTTCTGAIGHESIKLTEDDLEQISKFPNRVIIPDNDTAGEDYVKVWPDYCNVLKLPYIWPECPRKGDITDYINAGGNIENIMNYKFVDWYNETAWDDLTYGDFLDRSILRSIPDDTVIKIKVQECARKNHVRINDFKKLWEETRLPEMQKVERCNFPEGPTRLETIGYKTSHTGIFDKDGALVLPCPLTVTHRYKDVTLDKEYVGLAYYLNGKWYYLIASRQSIATVAGIVEALSDKGVPVDAVNAKGVIEYLRSLIVVNAGDIPEVVLVNHLGWYDASFLPYDQGSVQLNSQCDIKEFLKHIKAQGNLEEWENYTLNLRKNIKVRLIMAAAFASVLLGKLQVLPFIVSVWGMTGCGKTVALMVACSIWGDPELGKYIKSLNSTELNMTNIAAGLCNLPCMFDEWQVVQADYAKKKRSTDQLVMKLCEGVERGRADKSGNSRPTRNWHNCFIITGEAPMLESNSGGGTINRVIEIQCNDGNIVEDGHTAANFVRDNYGLAGPEFIKGLPSDEELCQRYKAIETELSQHGSTRKQSMALAALMVADEIASGMFWSKDVESAEEPLTVEQVRAFMRNILEVDRSERAKAYTINKIASNITKFKRTYTSKDSSLPCDANGIIWGEIKGNVVQFNRTELEALLNEGGFNFNEVKTPWSVNGFLNKKNGTYSVHGSGGMFVELNLTAEQLVAMGLSETGNEVREGLKLVKSGNAG